MLVEFVSVVDALRCSVEVQSRMAERNANVPQDRRIEFRVGPDWDIRPRSATNV